MQISRAALRIADLLAFPGEFAIRDDGCATGIAVVNVDPAGERVAGFQKYRVERSNEKGLIRAIRIISLIFVELAQDEWIGRKLQNLSGDSRPGWHEDSRRIVTEVVKDSMYGGLIDVPKLLHQVFDLRRRAPNLQCAVNE
jgi:hypothetical protein